MLGVIAYAMHMPWYLQGVQRGLDGTYMSQQKLHAQKSDKGWKKSAEGIGSSNAFRVTPWVMCKLLVIK